MKLLIVLSIIGAGVLGCLNNPLCGGLCEENTCEFCWASYLEKGTCKKVTTAVENCLVYAKEGTCNYCKLGFDLNANGGCVATTIKSCLWAQNGKCTICSNSAPDEKGFCGGKCSVDNCQGCGSEGCWYCNAGYYKQDFKCVQTTPAIEKCLVVDVNDKKVCIMCDYGYNLSTGKCNKIEGIAANTSFIKPTGTSAFVVSTGVLGLVAVSLF